MSAPDSRCQPEGATVRLTDTQLEALADLSDGEWKYGIHIRGRHSLPSLRKRGFVAQHYGHVSADEWQITKEGRAALSRLGTIRHLRRTSQVSRPHQQGE